MPERVSIGRLAFFLLLTLGLASASGQPAGRPSGQPSIEPPGQPSTVPSGQPADRPTDPPAAPVSPGVVTETRGLPGSTGDSKSSTAGSVPARTAGPAKVSSQDQFRIWLTSSSEGRWYSGVSRQIEDIAERIDRAGIPLDVIRTRMREAQAKRVGAEVFAEALEADAVYWLRIAALLDDSRWPPAAKAHDFYIAASNALRNGVSEGTISTLISWALASRGTPERAGAVLMSVSSLTGLMDSMQLSRTAGIMAASRLRVGEFDDLVVLLRRAKEAGRSSAELLAAMEDVLGKRGTLRTLERRLFS